MLPTSVEKMLPTSVDFKIYILECGPLIVSKGARSLEIKMSTKTFTDLFLYDLEI